MPASRSRSTANCLLRRFPRRTRAEGPSPFAPVRRRAPTPPAAWFKTNIFCSAVVDSRSSRTTPLSSSPLSAWRRVTSTTFGLVARGQPGDLPCRGRTQESHFQILTHLGAQLLQERQPAARPSFCGGREARRLRTGSTRPRAPTPARSTLPPVRAAAALSGSGHGWLPWRRRSSTSISRTDRVVIPRTCPAASHRVKPSRICGFSSRTVATIGAPLAPAAQRIAPSQPRPAAPAVGSGETDHPTRPAARDTPDRLCTKSSPCLHGGKIRERKRGAPRGLGNPPAPSSFWGR